MFTHNGCHFFSLQTSKTTPISKTIDMCNESYEYIIPRVSVDIKAKVCGVEIAVNVVADWSRQRFRTVIIKRWLLVSPMGQCNN